MSDGLGLPEAILGLHVNLQGADASLDGARLGFHQDKFMRENAAQAGLWSVSSNSWGSWYPAPSQPTGNGFPCSLNKCGCGGPIFG